jgi:type IV secretory pathway VirB2 component (pilin)
MKKFVSIMLTLAMMATMASGVWASLAIVEPAIDGGATTAVSKILGLVQWIGYAMAIGMLVYIGIKYVMSAANEKADLKKGLINYLIGAIIIFAASTIVGWVKTFVSSNVGS